MTANDTVARRRKLSADERALWGRVTRSLAPLKRRRSAADRGDADAPAVSYTHLTLPTIYSV